jgi:hypothetical protein
MKKLSTRFEVSASNFWAEMSKQVKWVRNVRVNYNYYSSFFFYACPSGKFLSKNANFFQPPIRKLPVSNIHHKYQKK